MSFSLIRVPRGLCAIILGIGFIVSGLGLAQALEPRKSVNVHQTPLQVVEALFTTLHQKPFNAIKIADLFDHGYVDHTRPENSLIKGTDRVAMVQFLAVLHHAVPDGTYVVDRIASMGDGRVLVSWYFEGTQAVQLVDGVLKKKRFKIQAVEIYRVENERIVEHWRVDAYAGLRNVRAPDLAWLVGLS